jgi:hypothetical protein
MPAPRKVDLLPPELKRWLEAELRIRGFAGYEALAEALNWKLEEEGLELRIQKSALHAFGAEYKDFARMQEEVQQEMRAFLIEASMADEAQVTKSLFQQLTAIQWRLQMSMTSEESMPDPRGVKDLTTALNNLIRSTSLRDAILKAERLAQAAKLDQAVAAGEVTEDFRAEARRIMGFA